VVAAPSPPAQASPDKASHYAERLRLVIDWFEKYRD
jgi:hypothetical protein